MRAIFFSTIWQDLKFAIRMLARNPGFTAIAVLILALGVGANTAVFSIVNGVLLRPLPFKDPDRLVAVLDARSSGGADWLFVSPNHFEEWARRNSAFEDIAATQNCYFKSGNQGDSVLLQGGCASARFFPMLGVEPVLGRLFTPEEDRPGGNLVAVLSYGTWKKNFGGDPAAIGKTIRRTANDAEFTIIGVLPPEFKFATEDFALWAPLATDPNYSDRDDHNLLVFARLKKDVTIAQAQSQMDGIAHQLEKEYPLSNTGWTVTVRPMQRFYSSVRNIRQTLWVLLGAVGLLLLIAGANIAGLLLARATSRGKEIAVRLALGATRRRLVRQLITESVLLGLLGGGAGFLLACLTFDSLLTLSPYIPSFRPNAIRLDGQVFAFAFAVSIVAAIAFGLAPASRASRFDLNASLRESGRGFRGGARSGIARRLLVISEIAVAVVLLAGAGLLLESFRNLRSDLLGFDSSHVLTGSICCLDQTHFHTLKEATAFYARLFESVREVPGVESVSGSDDLPLRHYQGPGSPFQIQGRAFPPGSNPTADFLFIEPAYFDTLRIPMVRGRALALQDNENSAPVAVVNQSLARSIWPGQDPVGQAIRPEAGDSTQRWYRVVGVAADTKERGLGTETRPTIYRSYYQSLARYTFLLIRTGPNPLSMTAAVNKAISSANGGLPGNSAASLDSQLAASISTERFSTSLLALFAGIALLLAGVGVYGVTSFSVVQRSHEVGVRIALGATPRDIFRLLVGEGLRLGFAGVALGVLMAMTLSRLIRVLLFGVGATDPLTFLAVSIVLLSVTVAACYFPARRAMRVDPVVALRNE